MLKRWNTFNESVDGRFTEEMAMEIVYYFSEDCSRQPVVKIETKNVLRFFVEIKKDLS